jgi:hypothetical protein
MLRISLASVATLSILSSADPGAAADLVTSLVIERSAGPGFGAVVRGRTQDLGRANGRLRSVVVPHADDVAIIDIHFGMGARSGSPVFDARAVQEGQREGAPERLFHAASGRSEQLDETKITIARGARPQGDHAAGLCPGGPGDLDALAEDAIAAPIPVRLQ